MSTWRADAPGSVLVVAAALVAACACDGRDAAPAAPDEAPGGSTATGPQPTRPTAEMATGDAFDFRIVRLSPRGHVGQPRACDVVFVGRLEAVAAEPPPRHPAGTVSRVEVKCASATGESWIDLGFDAGSADAAPGLRVGRRILVRVVARDGGFSDYTVAAFERDLGDAPPRARPPLAPSVEHGFDFGRLSTGALPADRDKTCGVDFASNIEIVGNRLRSRHSYAEDVIARMSVKCLSDDGDAWVDLVLTASDGMRPLHVARGASVRVRIATADGGHAGRPIVTLAPP